MEKDFTIFYTSAPESYDGFGTKTVRLTEYSDRNGKPVREISIPKSSTDWQFNRNSSGNFSTMSKETFDELSKNPNGGFHKKENEIDTISFANVKVGDNVIVSGYDVESKGTKQIAEGVVTFKYGNHYLNLNNTSDKYTYSNSYNLVPAKDLKENKTVSFGIGDIIEKKGSEILYKVLKVKTDLMGLSEYRIEPYINPTPNSAMWVAPYDYTLVKTAKDSQIARLKLSIKSYKENLKDAKPGSSSYLMFTSSIEKAETELAELEGKKETPLTYDFEDKEVVFHAMSKGGKDWFKITYDKKYNTFDKKSPTSMGGGYSETELHRIVKNELEYTPVVLIDKLKLTSDTVKDEDYKNNYFNEKAENRSYSNKEELNEAFKNNSPADANILAEYHDLLKDIIRLFNSGVVSASRYFGEKGIIDLSKKVGTAKTFKAARQLFLTFTKDAKETMKDYLLQADEPAIRLISEPLYNELKEKYVGNSDIKPEDTMKKEDRWQTIYGNNPDFAAVYSIGKSTKEVVVIKHKGKHYVIYADIAGVRREKDITHIGEAMEWLKGVLTKMSDVMGDKEVDESVIKDRLKLQYGKDLLEVNKTEMSKEKKYELGFGSMGNGTTVWNRAVKAGADYPTIAHISNEGVVNYYGKEYPAEVKKEIEDFAAKQKKPSVEKSVDAADAEVYIEYLNKDDRFKPMKKYFTSYSDAVKWGKEQFEKFDVDMVKYIDKSSKEPTEKAAPSTKDFEGSQESGTGKLYEYFTPMAVVEKMWALAYHYGKDVLPLHGMKVLDPAMGSGRLFTYAPKSAKVTGFEINKENEAVAMKYCVSRGFNRIQLYNESFEVAYLNPPRYNSKLKGKNPTWLDEYPFDLVVANPPYGKFTGLYKTHFNFNGQFEHFFIEYSMKLVKQNGLGIFVVPSSFLRNGNTYNSVKERIFNECKLVDAYRLPANIFKHTQIGTDIIVLQKK